MHMISCCAFNFLNRISILQDCIDAIKNWTSAKYLSLNTGKTGDLGSFVSIYLPKLMFLYLFSVYVYFFLSEPLFFDCFSPPLASVCVVAFQVICVAVLDIDPLWTAAGPSVR